MTARRFGDISLHMRARLGAAVLWLVVMGCPYGREMQPTGTGGGSAAGGAAAGGSVAGGAQAGGGSSSAGGAGGGSPELPDASVERDGGLDAGGPVGDSGVRDGGARPDAGLYRYVLTATEDTYVRSDLPSNNTGTVPYLVVDADPPPAVINKEALLRFQVGGGNIVRAELRLFSSNGSNSGLRVYHLTNTAWNELGTTWNNGPGLGTALLANLPVVPTDAGFTVDVTSVTRPHQPLALGLASSSGDGMVLNSREAPAERPMLTVTTTDAPPRACTGCLAGQLCDGDTGLCGCTASSCASPQTCGQRGRCVSRFKVMQFNILEGAVGNLPNGTPKLDAVVSIIQAVAPDLVTIDEANSTANFATLASRTGMFSNLCLAPNGYHVGVLSKKAFITKGCATPSPVTKAVNLVSVPVGGRTVFVYAVHLTATVGDAGEVYRANEMRAILPLAQHASEPVLIMGDLNSRFPEGTPGGLVTPLLTDARYVDAYREAHPDPVTSGGATGVGGVARIDYIFHDSELVRAVQAEVSNQYTPWPSDHYAVWAVLEL